MDVKNDIDKRMKKGDYVFRVIFSETLKKRLSFIPFKFMAEVKPENAHEVTTAEEAQNELGIDGAAVPDLTCLPENLTTGVKKEIAKLVFNGSPANDRRASNGSSEIKYELGTDDKNGKKVKVFLDLNNLPGGLVA